MAQGRCHRLFRVGLSGGQIGLRHRWSAAAAPVSCVGTHTWGSRGRHRRPRSDSSARLVLLGIPGSAGGKSHSTRGSRMRPMTERRDGIEDAKVGTRARFARLVARPETDIDLAAAALVIAAHGRPAPNESTVVDHLDGLADRVRIRLDDGDPTEQIVDRLHDVLYREVGYRGPT